MKQKITEAVVRGYNRSLTLNCAPHEPIVEEVLAALNGIDYVPKEQVLDVPEFLRGDGGTLTPTAAAMRTLSSSIRNDPSYAWSWHCNIACAYVDEGGDHSIANHAAHRFMQSAFGIKEPAHPLPEKYPEWLTPMDDDIRVDKLRITGSDDVKWLIAQLDAKRNKLAALCAEEMGRNA